MSRRRTLTPGVWFCVLASALVGACLVKDVELVDRLPSDGTGGDAGSSGSPSTAGSRPEGGEDSAGGDGASGGSVTGGNNPGGGKSSGGSAGSNSGGSAGNNTGGSGGSGGTGGGSPTEIPDPLLTCSDPGYLVCDDFESGVAGQWAPGAATTASTDAPSGGQVLATNFEQRALSSDLSAMTISFWVRTENLTDQRWLSFENAATLQQLGFGMEHERARWIHADPLTNQITAVAPSEDSNTRTLPANTWLCVELRVDLNQSSFEARVVVPGDAPFPLATLDTNPDAGQDDEWNNTLGNNWQVFPGEMFFGQSGTFVELDDVLIADYDVTSLCQAFLDSAD